MKKPTGYDELQVTFTPVELGGHHAIIKNVREMQSRTGKAMIVVSIEFAQNDKQPNYFMHSFDNDIRADKKWPFQGTQYILSEGNDGKVSRSFKQFIEAFEESNNLEATWGDAFCNQFKGRKIGVVFGNVEEEYNGEVKKRRRIRWFCNDSAVDNARIPEDKLLPTSSRQPAPPVTDKDGFMSIPDGSEEEIPF